MATLIDFPPFPVWQMPIGKHGADAEMTLPSDDDPPPDDDEPT